ncbi:MAG: alkaline phosphatase family protein [Ardenticatenales bacterium]|nr:alkaline phosphatase family protein [Ardenticatenales bacterium]
MALLVVFLDGVGVGEDNPASNPFLDADIPTWRSLAGGDWPTLADPRPRHSQHATLLPADATLGVEGEPQSGTGTTTLLTGENAPALLGRHAGPYPPRALHPLLQEKNILAQAAARGWQAAFANAYPPFFFERLERGKARRTTCTQAALAAGLTLRGSEALARGEALSPFLTNEHWSRLVPEVPLITLHEAGQNLARLVQAHDVTLFEFFQTDHRGHRPDMAEAHALLRDLDHFLAGILVELDPAKDLLVLASDHGNFEDQTHSNHTINPSLITLWGYEQEQLAAAIQNLTHITPLLLEWLERRENEKRPSE